MKEHFPRWGSACSFQIFTLFAMMSVTAPGCQPAEKPVASLRMNIEPVVAETYGALRAMMHEGKVGPKVRLDSLLPNGTLFGVGALSELRGEITIVNGDAFISYPAGKDSVRSLHSTGSAESAALLVTADVQFWTSVTTESAIDFSEIDLSIQRLAIDAGQDTTKAIPFLIRGRVEDLKWHVIDGTRLSGDAQTHEAHQEAAVTQTAASHLVTIVGFYSSHHQGVFTHRDSRAHMHAVSDDLTVSGHVDRVRLPAGTVIQFPTLNRDMLIETSMRFDDLLQRESYDSAHQLMGADPKRWFEMRDGAGGKWTVSSGDDGPWEAWDRAMNARKEILSWHRGDRSVSVRLRETNDYFRLLDRGRITLDRSYFFDDAGRIEGLVIASVFDRPSGRTSAFLEWAQSNEPEEIADLMPDGKINPNGDHASRYRALLIRWREDVGLPIIE